MRMDGAGSVVLVIVDGLPCMLVVLLALHQEKYKAQLTPNVSSSQNVLQI
jgi:hypothetical protein